MSKFTHFNEEGRAKMVDVSEKNVTSRVATAESVIEVSQEIYEGIVNEKMKKGDVLAVAQIAGIMAAKTRIKSSRCAIHYNFLESTSHLTGIRMTDTSYTSKRQ